MVSTPKKIALLHRYPADRIKETNAAFTFLPPGIDVLTFKNFDRLSNWNKFWKSLAWIFYAPMLVVGRGYDTIYCDDSFPFYPIFVKLASSGSRVVLRIGDFHLMYYVTGWLYDFLHFFERIGWLMADEILAISEVMADQIEKETKRRPKVVLDPVNPEDFPNNEPSEQRTVMFHGLLTKNKNVDILIEAARRLPEVDFTVVGGGPDLDRLMKIAPKNVFFSGWVPFRDVPHRIATCTVGVALRGSNPGNAYVVTSPFLQYGVMGKPCLVTRRKVFGDYLWQFSDVEELEIKIRTLLMTEISPLICRSEGNKLKDFILKNHDAKKIAGEIWSAL